MKTENLINWSALSTKLSGNPYGIRKNGYPKKYNIAIKELIVMLETWEKVYLKE